MNGVVTTPGSIIENGVLVIIAALVLSGAVFYFTKIWPKDREYQRTMLETVVRQVTIASGVIEANNMVVAQNSEMLKETQTSHARLGERMESAETAIHEVTECLKEHDRRAEHIGRETTQILNDTHALRARAEG